MRTLSFECSSVSYGWKLEENIQKTVCKWVIENSLKIYKNLFVCVFPAEIFPVPGIFYIKYQEYIFSQIPKWNIYFWAKTPSEIFSIRLHTMFRGYCFLKPIIFHREFSRVFISNRGIRRCFCISFNLPCFRGVLCIPWFYCVLLSQQKVEIASLFYSFFPDKYFQTPSNISNISVDHAPVLFIYFYYHPPS